LRRQSIPPQLIAQFHPVCSFTAAWGDGVLCERDRYTAKLYYPITNERAPCNLCKVSLIAEAVHDHELGMMAEHLFSDDPNPFLSKFLFIFMLPKVAASKAGQLDHTGLATDHPSPAITLIGAEAIVV